MKYANGDTVKIGDLLKVENIPGNVTSDTMKKYIGKIVRITGLQHTSNCINFICPTFNNYEERGWALSRFKKLQDWKTILGGQDDNTQTTTNIGPILP